MNHKTKTRVFKILSLLPDKLGYLIYHQLQNIKGNHAIDYKIKSTQKTFETVVRICTLNDISLVDKMIAEIGSGWVPIFPYQLLLNGKAKKVDTYDINEHFNQKEINNLNAYYSSQIGSKVEKIGKYPLMQGVSYYPNMSITNGNFKDIDLVLSRFVLEHVPPNDIIQMHEFLFDNLKPNGYVLHLISPSDHRAYTDSSLSLYDFLKYSEEQWNQIQTKFDYHNRLRLPQYLDILSRKFEILYFEHDKIDFNSQSYKAFKKLDIHDDFIKYSDQELMAGSINILLKRR